MYTFEVVVELKREVLDAEGRAIRDSLTRLGHQDLEAIQVSKRFLLNVAGSLNEAEQKASEIAGEFLANPVSETFTIRKFDAV